ncbi:glycosyltransferase family 4 protein [Marivirga sp. S37H4]|uniref:Glycosyltransferase family 4 protein n=1 Tax=Marivirga aurantiaca TaxID=2802615 RepID=A0A935C5N1_9BACT|nr:glycosyltransferase family 4 protein [Marivirga aurantiaca]MBK6263905.1 glycosyltransferase family 4 protein [Marivirga aurantiaca]
MRIAQVSPLYESVPPILYGGTERVVSYLTEELVRQGHEVSLFASGDSVSKARLRAPCNESLRLKKNCIDQLSYHFLMLEMLQQELDEFDIVHYHVDYLHFPLSRKNKKPHITTLHGRLDIPDIHPLFKEYREMPVVSISHSQRSPIPYANWVGNVYHGLPITETRYNNNTGEYLAFLGRICPEKGVDLAIEIAIKCGIPLKIAAKIDKADAEYFHREIKHLLNHPLIEYIGEIGEKEKSQFLRNAMALLFPINWPEPFGLVMIESMACGTPVIAFEKGSVPEIVEEGITGFIVNSVSEALETIQSKLPAFNRFLCRATFEKRFTVERMANEYVKLYQQEASLNHQELSKNYQYKAKFLE